ncbi:MAG: diguanylate cyclase [Desulfovibrio sp.]|nr:MAG: diguanylate cyclase [Desulfovibrio sp.]
MANDPRHIPPLQDACPDTGSSLESSAGHSHIRNLEERIQALTQEKSAVLNALEMAASLSAFTVDPEDGKDPVTQLLEETASRLATLTRFQALGFFLVNHEDGDLVPRLLYPASEQDRLLDELEGVIENRTLSWALNKNRPLVISTLDKSGAPGILLLHALSTPARTHGIFLGIPDKSKEDIPDVSFGLITTILLSCSNTLESFELYLHIRSMNQALQANVAKLAASEQELKLHRGKLEEEVAERTQDLSLANTELRKEVRERESAQQALQKEKDFVSAVLDTSGALVVVMDTQATVIRFNKAAEAVTGYMAQEVLGKSAVDLFIPSKDQGEILRVAERLADGESPLQHANDWRIKDGTLRRIAWSDTFLANENGEIEYIIATGIDITERTRAQSALREAEATYRNIFENAVEGIFQATTKYGFHNANPAMARMLGYASSKELITESPGLGEQLSVNPEDFGSFLLELRTKGQVANFELLARCKDHRRIWISVSARLVPSSQDDDLEEIEGLVEDITDRKISEMHLERQATYDELTDIPNRFLFKARFDQVLTQAERMGHALAVLYIDLDSFKEINDTLGHHVGDTVLKEVARRLQSRVRRSDLLARIGGDEFAALLINISSRERVPKVALGILKELVRPYTVKGKECQIGASIGASLFPDDGSTMEELLRKADAAMYKAKDQGGNVFCFFDGACSIDHEA